MLFVMCVVGHDYNLVLTYLHIERQVHKNIRAQLEAAGLKLERLFIVSAWTLQELVASLVKEHELKDEPTFPEKLMDEAVLTYMLIK